MTNVNTREYWDGEWARNVKKFPRYTMNRISGLIPMGSSVIDIGCGNGKFLRKVLAEREPTELFGIDISEVAIRKVKDSGLDGLVMNAENLDSFDRQFDVVICTHIFEHVDNDTGLAKNVARIAKKMAIIAVPNDCSYPEITGEHVRKYTLESLSKLFVNCFREIIDCTRLNREYLKNHLIIVVKK
jgi:2-polyprenyl-3-methyl-5-hydroxy-6-metoxy-1,4-benzoquinol methylase